MIDEVAITCPNCRQNIKLSESLAAPLIEATRQKLELEYREKDTDVRQRESWIREQHKLLLAQEQSIETLVQDKLQSERKLIAEEQETRIRLAVANEIKVKNEELASFREIIMDRDEKLQQHRKTELDLMRKQRELNDAIQTQELIVEKRIQESLSDIREQAQKNAEEQAKLKVLEKEHLITSMQKQIEELKRKSEQGSQQLQGEVQELDLESTLRVKFPLDSIEPIAKGENGGDILQMVIDNSGQICGTILWESKRTKSWADTWLSKAREDQRSAKADIAIIASQVMPKHIESFDLMDDVWVTRPKYLVPLTIALRQFLTEIAAARLTRQGQQTKMELTYQYLTGTGFRHRIKAIVEQLIEMQCDLDKEQRAAARSFAKRRKQIHCAVDATAGMYGDLQGIVALQEIEGLEIEADELNENSALQKEHAEFFGLLGVDK